MKYFNKLNSHKYLFLERLIEPDNEGKLKLIIAEAISTGPLEDIELGDTKIEDVQLILSTEECSVYEVSFDDYIHFSILNESFISEGNFSGNFEGKLFSIASDSLYLDFVKKISFTCNDFPGPFKHYRFNCEDHVVDIASVKEPQIKLIKCT